MAENSNGRLTLADQTERTPPSTADMKTAIRETRDRLALRLARTADHTHRLFTTPSSVDRGAPDSGIVARVIRTIAAVGGVKAAWSDARRTGLVGRGAFAGVIVAIAAVLATRTKRR